MTEPELPARVAAWFERLLGYASSHCRATRVAQAGPVRISHFFDEGHDHEDLLSAVIAGGPATTDLAVYSLVDPPPALMDPSPVTAADIGGRGGVRGLHGTRWRMSWDGYAGIVRCYDRERRLGVLASRGPLEAWERAAPFRSHLHWAAAATGSAMVHAAAVGTPDGVGLVLGPGGTGKSTTVEVALSAGLGTCGDDYVWLEPSTDTTYARAVYGTVKTKGPDRSVHPAARTLRLDEADKTIHWLAEADEGWFVGRAPVTCTLALGDARDLRAATLASSLLQLPDDEEAVARVLAGLTRSVPVVVIPRTGDLGVVREVLVGEFPVRVT